MKPVFFEKIKGFGNKNSGQTHAIICETDHSVLRNRMMAVSIFAGLLITVSSFSFGPVDDATMVSNEPQKKVQRVKVVVNKDGKETKIDTVFNLPDEAMINFKVDSMLKSLNIEGLEAGKFNVPFHRGGKAIYLNHQGKDSLAGKEQFDIFIQNSDSGRMGHKKKVIRIGEGASFQFEDDNGDLLGPPSPPPPPVPPFPFEFNQSYNSDPFAFDPDDAAIISYDKKDIGKGLEKITIVRKKQAGRDIKKEVNVKVDVSDDSKQ